MLLCSAAGWPSPLCGGRWDSAQARQLALSLRVPCRSWICPAGFLGVPWRAQVERHGVVWGLPAPWLWRSLGWMLPARETRVVSVFRSRGVRSLQAIRVLRDRCVLALPSSMGGARGGFALPGLCGPLTPCCPPPPLPNSSPSSR